MKANAFALGYALPVFLLAAAILGAAWWMSSPPFSSQAGVAQALTALGAEVVWAKSTLPYHVSVVSLDYPGANPSQDRSVPAEFGPLVAQLSQLKAVSLSGRAGVRAALPHLQGLQHLSVVSFAGSDITDEDLVNHPLPAVEELYLGGTRVTEKCVPALAKLPKLKTVDLPLSISKEAVAALTRKGIATPIQDAKIRQPSE